MGGGLAVESWPWEAGGGLAMGGGRRVGRGELAVGGVLAGESWPWEAGGELAMGGRRKVGHGRQEE